MLEMAGGRGGEDDGGQHVGDMSKIKISSA